MEGAGHVKEEDEAMKQNGDNMADDDEIEAEDALNETEKEQLMAANKTASQDAVVRRKTEPQPESTVSREKSLKTCKENGHRNPWNSYPPR